MNMPFTDEDLFQPVTNIIKNKISPLLAKDGGAIELLKIKNGKIYVQLQGAIEYKDFQELVQRRGSFKEAYQDIMFSTKVAITTKDELIDFINKLIENNFSNTAYTYLDGFNEFFSYDEDLTALYKKLERKSIENSH